MLNPLLPPNCIREQREAAGLTLQALAERIGTTNQQLSHLELGKRELTVTRLRRIARGLDCHPWSLVEAGGGASLTAVRRADPRPSGAGGDARKGRRLEP